MNKTIVTILVVLLVAVGIVASSALFTVHQTQQAIVMQFGNPERVIQEPGLNFKLPFVQDVVYVDKRVLSVSTQREETRPEAPDGGQLRAVPYRQSAVVLPVIW